MRTRKTLVLIVSMVVLLGWLAVPLTAGAEPDSCADCSVCAKRLLADMEHRGWLGMGLHLHGDQRLDGLEVQFLDQDGPAYAAGIRQGDAVISIQGLAVKELSTEEVLDLFQGLQPGERVTVELISTGEPREVILRAAPMSLKAKAQALGAYFIRQLALERESGRTGNPSPGDR